MLNSNPPLYIKIFIDRWKQMIQSTQDKKEEFSALLLLLYAMAVGFVFLVVEYAPGIAVALFSAIMIHPHLLLINAVGRKISWLPPFIVMLTLIIFYFVVTPQYISHVVQIFTTTLSFVLGLLFHILGYVAFREIQSKQ